MKLSWFERSFKPEEAFGTDTLIDAQVRIDETQLRQKRADAIKRLTRLAEEELNRQRRLG